jgi:sporulation protein YlmC with PRC-barrel domain
MPAARVVHAALQLLDRQLVDRDGRLCGKVDDVELEPSDDGRIYVSALLTGPGQLLQRLGRPRLGAWLQRITAVVFGEVDGTPSRIPLGRVSDLGNHVTVSIDREELATYAAERWVVDHVISHIPGSSHDADSSE